MPTRICFIRHGETDWNATKRIQGQADIPLNETGRAQAQAMALNVAHDEFSAVYSSDLIRAVDTAQMVAVRRGLEIHQLPQLRERHFGIFQGITADEGARRYAQAYAHYKARDVDYDFETGESLRDFARRVYEAVELMTRHHRNQAIVAICHAGVLDIVYRKATGRPLQAPRDFPIRNCALNWFRCDDHGGDERRWHLEAWDNHPYLAQVPIESVE
ncbi:MAG: histidine phosphatase family protein [Nitrosomonadales bacterium]|nr:histidine phosphatase family protein [Nitrosomonadales bacterium]